MAEVIHDGPKAESIVETHLGGSFRPTVVRDKMHAFIPMVNRQQRDECIDAILDLIHAEMMHRTGVGAVLIGRIKRGEV